MEMGGGRVTDEVGWVMVGGGSGGDGVRSVTRFK